MVLEIAPEMNGCAAAIMRIWLSTDRIALADRARTGWRNRRPARCSFFRWGAPSSVIAPQTWTLAASISAFEKPRKLQQVEATCRRAARRSTFSVACEEVLAERPLVEDELDVEGGLQAALDRFDLLVGKPLAFSEPWVDAGRLVHVAMTHSIGLDLGDLVFRITQRAQGGGDGAVDDLEVAATGELLELDQREVRLDAGGVAIHDQADGAGRRDHRRLGVAVAMLLAELQRLVPGGGRVGDRGRRSRAVAMDRAATGVTEQAPHSLWLRHARRGGGCG